MRYTVRHTNLLADEYLGELRRQLCGMVGITEPGDLLNDFVQS